ncbi:MAG: DNA polymerase I [Bacteroidetes bacterium]|nr:DNA polymerase I [Bacteroidota bacterium]
MSEKRLFLIDGHAIVYRAHYAFINRPLMNSKGLNTSAITGFVRTLWDLIKNQKPTHLAVSFDLPGPTFRHEMFEAYKANRQAQPEDISIALPYIKSIIKAFNIPVVVKEGYEADDVIGTLAKQAEKEGFNVFMVTPDKDYAQLVSENIFFYKPSGRGNDVEILGEKEIREKWEIERIDQVVDILGLQGDSVDNIPGIPGVGPKTAKTLLKKYDSVEKLIANAHELKGKQKERVTEFADQAILSKQLAKIDTEVPIQFDAKTFELEPFNKKKLSEIFKELEFRTLAATILGSGTSSQVGKQQSLFSDQELANSSSTPHVKVPPVHSVADNNINNTAHEYHLVGTKEKREELIELLSRQENFCFDTETTGIDANQAELVGISFSIQAHKAYYVPVPSDQNEAGILLKEFRDLFENEKIGKTGQNIKYDILILKWYDVEVNGALFDTMIAHYLIEPELRHGMNYLAETYLEYQPLSIETLIGKRKKGAKQLTMRDVGVERVKEYAAEDADVTLQLKNYFTPKLKEEELEELFFNLEIPLVKVLADLEHAGINLDSGFLNQYSAELDKEIIAIEKEIYELAGVKFNIASPRQVGNVLFERMEIPYRWRKTKTGQYSTNEEKLTELAKDFPIVNHILKSRGLNKLKSTYVDALPKMVNPKTGRVHSSFNQALAATGRLSSNNPNLQNIPIRTPEGRKVREAFIPRDEDHVLLAADYSQIELRLIAELSGDEAMLEAFNAGQDIHSATAAKVFDVPFDEVTKEQRYKAKTVNFSIIYGAGATNLSRQLDIRRSEAQHLISQYFTKYLGLKVYMDKCVKDAREKGYVKTLMGRRRYLRDINSRNSMVRSHAERNAINTPIQGSAADMIKIAMINIHKALKEGNYKTQMILQVHDELVFDVPKTELDAVKPMIEEKMKNAIPSLKVPIVVESGIGNNWLEAH